MKWSEGNISEFQRKKAKWMRSRSFPMIDQKYETHQTMMKVECSLVASGY